MSASTVPLRALRPAPPELDNGYVISVCSNKGGTGKTTVLLKLAYYMAMLGYEVVVVDWDPQCNASTRLGFHMDGSDSDLYSADDLMAKTWHGGAAETLERPRWVLTSAKGTPIRDHAGESIPDPINDRIHLVPGHPDLEERYLEIVHADARFRLDAALQGVKNGRIVLVDTGPSLGALVETAWAASDAVLGVSPLYYDEIEGVVKSANKLHSIRRSLGRPELDMRGVVVNQHIPTRSTQKRNLGDLIAALGPDTVWTDMPVPELEQIRSIQDQHKSYARIAGTQDANRINNAGQALADRVLREVIGVAA